MCRVVWESSYCQNAGGQLFQIPTGKQPFVAQHKAHMREMVNYFLIDVVQVFRVYMTWKLAAYAAMGTKPIYYYYLIQRFVLYQIPAFFTWHIQL